MFIGPALSFLKRRGVLMDVQVAAVTKVNVYNLYIFFVCLTVIIFTFCHDLHWILDFVEPAL